MSTFDSRFNMVERQIRTWDVLDERVLSLYTERELLREEFVADPACRDLAYADMMLPTACGQVMLEPKLEARMLQELAPRPDEKILHVGGGSGFFAALLGRLAKEVISVEIVPELADTAAARLGDGNVRVVCADAARGYVTAEPYDAVVLTGSTPRIAEEFFAQLKPGGRLLAVVGVEPAMRLCLAQKTAGDIVIRRDILETCIPPLVNAPSADAFVF